MCDLSRGHSREQKQMLDPEELQFQVVASHRWGSEPARASASSVHSDCQAISSSQVFIFSSLVFESIWFFST